MITDRRSERIKEVVAKRQGDLTVILENVHDPHNIGAVLRSCDSVGIGEIFVLLTEDHLTEERYVGTSSSSGAKKWVDVHFFNDVSKCMKHVKTKYQSIYGTHLDSDSVSLYDLDLSSSCALMFGNEHDGISREALKHLDGNFIIPQHGMVQSLNISVACAVSLYEASRQRMNQGRYSVPFNSSMEAAYAKYVEITRKLR
ncbi:MAG: RNA methyltransferase [Saprospiraceae bacterium]|nr:RNA methyltransferase [Saprospiraceae bacterium]